MNSAQTDDNKYQLSKNFLKKTRIILSVCLTLTILITVVFLLIRPANLIKSVYDNDRDYTYMIYTHVASYFMAIFSIALLIWLLDTKRLTANIIIFPVFVFALKVLALGGYYYYYTNTTNKSFNFKTDYFGMFYLAFTFILFCLYITIFVDAIKERHKIRKFNTPENINLKSKDELINESFNKYFRNSRVNPAYENWLKRHINDSVGNTLNENKIDQRMNEAYESYISGEQFATASGKLPPNNVHDMFPSFLNYHYSGGMSENTLPHSNYKNDLRYNNFLNPKILAFVDQLVNSGININNIPDYFPQNDDGDFKEQIIKYARQLKNGNPLKINTTRM